MDLFLHIPKTAGVTIHEIAKRHYTNEKVYILSSLPGHTLGELLAWPPDFREGLRYIGGHFPYGLHWHLRQPCRYVTMMRDPALTMLSLYYYILRSDDHPEKEALTQSGVTFREWIAGQWGSMWDNHQLRCLIGKPPGQPICRSDVDYAKHLVKHEIAVTGLVERFDESVLLIAGALGWGTPFYSPANVHHRAEDFLDLTDDMRGLIAQHHAGSYELLHFARELFEERVRAAGSEFARRLAEFKEKNAEWQAQH